LLLAQEDTWGSAYRAFVQWIDEPSARGAARVWATAEVPSEETVSLWPAPEIMKRDGRWYATLTSTKLSKWGNKRRLAVELGSPGALTLLPDSTRARLFERRR
jgi:hypothetical protein